MDNSKEKSFHRLFLSSPLCIVIYVSLKRKDRMREFSKCVQRDGKSRAFNSQYEKLSEMYFVKSFLIQSAYTFPQLFI